MGEKISIIVPVYNAEKYIIQCIESLLSQTLQECEFIFVNDGSKDNSRKIIECFERNDKRIRIINQTNQGVSIARNIGLSAARGEYIGFVDADDYVEKDMYEILYKTAKKDNCDAVISNFEEEIEGHKIITKYSFPRDIVLKKDFIEQELLPYFLRMDNLNTAVNKIYRTNTIKEKNIKFPEKVELGEDGMFNILFFNNAEKVKYIDYRGYHYREVKGSATRNISEKDYFKRAVEVYKVDMSKVFINMDDIKIRQLQAIKLINSLMSYVHIYFQPCKDMGFKKRYQYVKKMIQDRYVREALPIYYSNVYYTLGKYERFIISLIKIKSTIGLYCVTSYSRYKNKQ
ncbi:glycosyltransferase [Bacillus paramobilis]|uniref:glycosyltransferase n=1 Tax=Bacillus paramobilis TaxID=2817477 RepID=UPI0030C9FECF